MVGVYSQLAIIILLVIFYYVVVGLMMDFD